jgi:hypothetical protein
MKKLIFMSLAGIIGLSMVIVACKKEVPEQQPLKMISLEKSLPRFSNDFLLNVVKGTYSEEKVGGERWRRFWKKVGDWFVDHAGVHMFGDCGLNLSCGPCPGLCISAGIIDGQSNGGNDEASPSDYSNGLRVYGIDILVDPETNQEYVMFKFNNDVSDFVNGGFFYVKDDIDLNNSMSNGLSKQKITLKKGKYEVVHDTSTGYYYSLVDSNML